MKDNTIDVNEEMLKHVAELARLNLSPEEIKIFLPQLKEVINMVSKLHEVNTDGVKSSFQPVELKDHVRDDVINPSLTQSDALKNSSNNQDGYFKGPKAV